MTQLSTFNNLTGLESATPLIGKSATFGGKRTRKNKRTKRRGKKIIKKVKKTYRLRRH